MPIINLRSATETISFGKKLAAKLHGGDILCLYGDLGAGKTTLVKGIAAGLGIKKEITSPTFALMNIYHCKIKLPQHKITAAQNHKKILNIKILNINRLQTSTIKIEDGQKENSNLIFNNQYSILKFVHIDTYRLKNARELIDIGAEDYLDRPDAICVIEWPEKIAGLLKNKKTLAVKMSHADGGRIIDFPAELR